MSATKNPPITLEAFVRDYRNFEQAAKALPASLSVFRLDQAMELQTELFEKHDLLRHLKKYGISKLRHVDSGSSAYVFDTIYGQLVRISRNEPDLPYMPEMLQPLLSESVDGYHVEIYPEVTPALHSEKSLHEMVRDRDALINSLANHHPPYWFFDCSLANFGYLSNGTPVIFDRGAVLPEPVVADTLQVKGLKGGSYLGRFAKLLWFEAAKEELVQQRFDMTRQEFEEALKRIDEEFAKPPTKEELDLGRSSYQTLKDAPPPTYDFAEAQADHNRQRGLASKNLRGVMPPEFLAQFREPRREMLLKAQAQRAALLAKAEATPEALTAEERAQLQRKFVPSPDKPSAFDSLMEASGGYLPVAGQVVQRAVDSYPAPNRGVLGKLHRLLSASDQQKALDPRGLCERIKDEQRKALDPSNGRS